MADELLNFVSVDGASFSGMPASKTKKDGTVVQARAKTPEPHWTELEAIYGPVDGSAQPDTNPITSGPNAGLRLKLCPLHTSTTKEACGLSRVRHN